MTTATKRRTIRNFAQVVETLIKIIRRYIFTLLIKDDTTLKMKKTLEKDSKKRLVMPEETSIFPSAIDKPCLQFEQSILGDSIRYLVL